METRNRTIDQWLGDIDRGAVQLPRFQRQVAWNVELVKRFLQAILDERPLGVFLVLEVDPHNQPFRIRPIRGASNGSERCRQHLLDGQQRLTALWSVFTGGHDTHEFYVAFQRDGNEFTLDAVEAISRSGRNRKVIGKPALEYDQGWMPLKVIAPTEGGVNARIRWRDEALADADDTAVRTGLEWLMEDLRRRVGNTQIPYFSLPQDTSKEDAIDIFIETNRSSVQLTPYDLAVAQMEEKTGESLEEKKNDLIVQVPRIADLEGESSVGDLILKLQCLREARKPTLGNYEHLDFPHLNAAWDEIVQGVEWTVGLLDDMSVHPNRLPTAVPLRVLPLLAPHVPAAGVARARASQLVRRYVWAAFLTDRYDRQANDRLKEDYEALRGLLERIESVRSDTPIPGGAEPPESAEIRTASWPSGRSRLGRAILAACSLGGARDIASNDYLGKDGTGELHHIFPKAVLRDAGVDANRANCAMNCMLLHPPTNRGWAKKLPGDYLIDTIKAAGVLDAGGVDDDAAREVSARLHTQCVPSGELLEVRAGCADVAAAYERFVERRVRLTEERIDVLLRDGGLEAS